MAIAAGDRPSTPLQRLNHGALRAAGVTAWVKRLDLAPPEVNGNKGYKLAGYIAAAARAGVAGVASFGGAWSNHLHALAAAGRAAGLATAGIVRLQAAAPWTATLEDCRRWGMRLLPVSPATYRRRGEPGLVAELAPELADYLVVPEGASGEVGVSGCAAIVAETEAQLGHAADQFWLPVGTGATLAGIARACNRAQRVVGVPILPRFGAQAEAIMHWLEAFPACGNWELLDGYHGGGYARFDRALARLITEMARDHDLPLEPVYSAKALSALLDHAARGLLAAGNTVVLVHTGGLQGLRGTAGLLRELRDA